jgi:hypothetical protein
MTKLIVKAQAEPTAANIEKLRIYLIKHPMATCMATPEEVAYLKSIGLY